MPTTLDEQIASLIRDHDIVIFAKGTRDFPQCGFSARTVQIFQQLEHPFEVFNVLPELEANRAALSAIVEEQTGGAWRTTPQVYVKGQFIGGCDIVTEMFESGELQTTLQSALDGRVG